MTIQSCNLKTGGLQPIKHFNPEVQMFSFIGSGTCTNKQIKKEKKSEKNRSSRKYSMQRCTSEKEKVTHHPEVHEYKVTKNFVISVYSVLLYLLFSIYPYDF